MNNHQGKTFTDKLIEYATPFTNCPPLFLNWAAKICLSVVAGRRCFMETGNGCIYPNIWVIILGPTSSHKSTALSIARRLLRNVMPDTLLPQEFSQEKVLEDISIQPHRLLVYDEASGFFAVVNQQINPILKSALMSLWHDDYYVRRTKKTEIVIQNPYLCFGGASTPQDLLTSFQNRYNSILSGFLPRFLLVPFFEKPDPSIPLPPPHNHSLFIELENELRSIAEFSFKPFYYSPQAKLGFEKWYARKVEESQSKEFVLHPFYGKIVDEHVHKLSMLSAIEHKRSVIQPEDFHSARLELMQVEHCWPELLQKFVQRPTDIDRERVLEAIKNSIELDRTALSHKIRIYGKRLSYHLDGLLADDIISSSSIKTHGRTRTLITYKMGK
jgi:hypothetical protein